MKEEKANRWQYIIVAVLATLVSIIAVVGTTYLFLAFLYMEQSIWEWETTGRILLYAVAILFTPFAFKSMFDSIGKNAIKREVYRMLTKEMEIDLRDEDGQA